MPQISVIMGVYNTNNEQMLELAINSIVNQTFKDIEFIICDDGSSDNTYSLLKKIAQKDKRIVLIRNKDNLGLAATLNKCIGLAGGEYIARQDADDYSIEDRLEKQLNFLERYRKYSFVGSNISYFDEGGIWGQYLFKEFPKREDFLFRTPFMHGTLVYRKQDLLACGNYKVTKETRRCEDYELFMRFYTNKYIGANLTDKLYCFRENKEAMGRRKFKYRIDEVKVRYKGFKDLGLMPKGILFVMKPIVIGLIPKKSLDKLKDIFYKRKIYNGDQKHYKG